VGPDLRPRKLPPPPPPKPPIVAPKEPTPEQVEKAREVAGLDVPADPKVADLVDDETVIARARRMRGRDGRAISHALAFLLDLSPEEFLEAAANVQTKAEEIAVQLVVKATSGTQEAIKICLERTEGRVPQALEVSTNSHKDIHERVGDIAISRANAAAATATGLRISAESADLDLSEDEPDRPEEDD